MLIIKNAKTTWWRRANTEIRDSPLKTQDRSDYSPNHVIDLCPFSLIDSLSPRLIGG